MSFDEYLLTVDLGKYTEDYNQNLLEDLGRELNGSYNDTVGSESSISRMA